MTNQPLSFLFFHYGKIPSYLVHAIEHVRVFNPEAEIQLIADTIKNTSMLDRFGVRVTRIEDYQSEELSRFKDTYHHLSSCDERYERFCFERWFVTETLRRRSPEKKYILIDSDVGVFSEAINLLKTMPDCPISVCGGSPHYTFVKEDISAFLNYILDSFSSPQKIAELVEIIGKAKTRGENLNLNDQEFLLMFMAHSDRIRNYSSESSQGYADANIHRPEGFVHLELRRRPRKKIFWRLENGRTIPYFKKGDEFVKALILHFQGPGKRVFRRFNSLDGPASSLQIWWWNHIFQRRWLANLM
jgi:hypothetical protein